MFTQELKPKSRVRPVVVFTEKVEFVLPVIERETL
jgi:hypothetical protein